MSGLKMEVVDSKVQLSSNSTGGRIVIKVIGSGSGGCNALNQMIDSHITGVDFIAVNTDMQALEACKAPTRIALGQNLTGGLGAGGNPDIGSRAAQEDRQTLEQIMQGAHMVFLTTGLGGGTGTGSLPIIAEVAKKNGALVVSIVTMPFSFDGARKMDIAREGLEDLKKNTDALIVIPNEKLLAMADRKATMIELFAKANDLLRIGVQGIVDLINYHGHMNVDFNDVKSVMSFQGEAIMGQATGRGDNRAMDALRGALNCPLVENGDIDGAKGLLVNVTTGKDFAMAEYAEIMHELDERIDKNATRKNGWVIDNDLNDEVRITIIATGFHRDAIRSMKPRVVERNFKPVGVDHKKSDLGSSLPSYDKENYDNLVKNDEEIDTSRGGVVASEAWDRLLGGGRRALEVKKNSFDESVPSYLRMKKEG